MIYYCIKQHDSPPKSEAYILAVVLCCFISPLFMWIPFVMDSCYEHRTTQVMIQQQSVSQMAQPQMVMAQPHMVMAQPVMAQAVAAPVQYGNAPPTYQPPPGYGQPVPVQAFAQAPPGYAQGQPAVAQVIARPMP